MKVSGGRRPPQGGPKKASAASVPWDAPESEASTSMTVVSATGVTPRMPARTAVSRRQSKRSAARRRFDSGTRSATRVAATRSSGVPP